MTVRGGAHRQQVTFTPWPNELQWWMSSWAPPVVSCWLTSLRLSLGESMLSAKARHWRLPAEEQHHGTTVLTTPPHGHWSPRSSPVTTTQDWVSCPSTTMMTTYLVFCSCPSISWSKVCCRPWANDLTCSPSTTTASPQDDAASWASQGSWLGVRGCWLRLGR